MSQPILDDGINVLGSTFANPIVHEDPVVITAPADGAVDVPAPVVLTGTADPGSTIDVKVSSGSAGQNDVAKGLAVDETGAWTATLDAWPSWIDDGATATFIARYPDTTEGAAQVDVTAEKPAALAATTAYDPSQHTVVEVQSYLAEHPEETETVLAAERAGKNRATLVNTEEI